MKSLICSVSPDNYIPEVAAEKRLVLLFFMLADDVYPGQLKIVEHVANKYHDCLKVCIPSGETMEMFKRKFRIVGTPTFLLMMKNKEICRIYGVVEQAALEDAINQHLSATQ
jgi:hypothetical protein